MNAPAPEPTSDKPRCRRRYRMSSVHAMILALSVLAVLIGWISREATWGWVVLGVALGSALLIVIRNWRFLVDLLLTGMKEPHENIDGPLWEGPRVRRSKKVVGNHLDATWSKHARAAAEDFRRRQWSRQLWTPSPALREKGAKYASVKYVGQYYDPDKYEVVVDGWNHDHCQFCWKTIVDTPGPDAATEGYTDGNDWLCDDCYQTVIVEGKDP